MPDQRERRDDPRFGLRGSEIGPEPMQRFRKTTDRIPAQLIKAQPLLGLHRPRGSVQQCYDGAFAQGALCQNVGQIIGGLRGPVRDGVHGGHRLSHRGFELGEEQFGFAGEISIYTRSADPRRRRDRIDAGSGIAMVAEHRGGCLENQRTPISRRHPRPPSRVCLFACRHHFPLARAISDC